jgi:hypothetical protein
MDLEALERRIRRLEDLEEIKQLKARYAAYCDAGYDADALADLFTTDAVWDGGMLGRNEGREAIRAILPRVEPAHLVCRPQYSQPRHRDRR